MLPNADTGEPVMRTSSKFASFIILVWIISTLSRSKLKTVMADDGVCLMGAFVLGLVVRLMGYSILNNEDPRRIVKLMSGRSSGDDMEAEGE
jgi:hypothetical protein